MYRILIVDDDRTICRCLKELITWERIDCLPPMIAHDGLTALEMIEECKPDIIITDLRMPAMSGAALCEEVYSRHTDIDMIFFSAYEDFKAAKVAIKYGVSDYVMKPINRETLENIQIIIRNIQHRREKGSHEKHNVLPQKLDKTQEIKEENEVLVDLVRKIVQKNYGDPNLSVEDIAGQVGFSADYLGKLFVGSTGEPLYAFIRDYRIQKAVELLKQSRLSVAEIAEKVGYLYPNYFAKIFRNKLGITPTEYRNKYYRENKLSQLE